MEEDFPSIVIGDNTLAAIEDAEKKDKKYNDYGCEKKSNERATFIGENIFFGPLPSNKRLSENLSKFDVEAIAHNVDDLKHHSVSLCNLSAYLDTYMDRINASIIDEIHTDSGVSHLGLEQTDQKAQIFNLKDYGLPTEILKKYDELGIKSMFQWQHECLSNELVLSGKNLIYSAPTSAGKTLVAEILTTRTVFEQKRKAVIILPFISVVKEKTNYFQELMEGTGIRVEGFMGGFSPAGGFKHTDIAICTIEKANSLIIRLMEDGSLSDLGIVVVDELHLLGDTHRGYLLELLLTKIRYMCLRDKINIQIVGMSATLPNLELLANWLHAELYQTNFRPVPLKELIKLGKTIYDNNMKKVFQVDFGLPVKGDPDDVTFLCLETIAQGFSVLIFCPTKNWCEKLAETIAKDFFYVGTSSASMPKEEKELVGKFVNELNKSPLTKIVDKLKRSPVGLDPILAKTVLLGVAFHHAGLTMDERDILESSFRSGALRVLVATSTLSSGVNLPARRVIVRTPIFHGKLVDILTYKQMIGRAGRMGVDTAGESILVCHEKDKSMVERLLKSDLPPIQSCLGSGRSSKLSASLKRAIFEVVASGVATTPEEVEHYTNLTLLAAIMKIEKQTNFQIRDPLKSCLKYLEESEFIRLENTGEDGAMKYVATHLGEACLAASLPPDQALSLFEELQRARKCFVLEDELHIIYQVTPFSVADQWGDNLDWLHLLNMWESLPSSLQRVGELVGVEERFIVRAMKGTLNVRAPKQMEKMGIHRRFYTALALRELANEVPINDVAQKYGCSRGMLQNLQQSAAIFAGMVTQFCRRLRWTGLESLASELQDRLQFGIRGELCDLMRLPLLDGQCARALFDAGIENLAVLAADASPAKVDQALRAYLPFQSEKNKEEGPYEGGMKKKWISSMSSVRNLLEKNVAVLLIKEARKIIQKELGVAVMKWNDDLEVSMDSSESVLPSPEKQSDVPVHSSVSNSVVVESPVLSFENGNVNNQNVSLVSADAIIGGNPSSNERNTPDGRVVKEQSHVNDNIASTNTTFVKSCLPCNECESSKIPKSNTCNNLNESRDGVSNSVHLAHIEMKNNSLGSNQMSPVVISSSPITSIVAGQSGRRSSSDFNRTKRTSLDIFSSPLADDTPAENIINQSPSLFGDSFTVDTQLETLMNGSSGSNKVQSVPSVTDNNQALNRCTSNCDSTPKLPVCNSGMTRNTSSGGHSTPSNPSKPSQIMNRLNFNRHSPTEHSIPQAKSLVIPETLEISEICFSGEIITPSKWDFGSIVKIADAFETACENDSSPADLKSSIVGVELVHPLEHCKDEETILDTSSEAETRTFSRKQVPMDSQNGMSEGNPSAWGSRRSVIAERDVFDSKVEFRGGDSNEVRPKGTTEGIKVEENLSLVGSDLGVKEKRLSLDAVSSSFLEKAFTSAFDFEDEATMRVESSGGQIEKPGGHNGGEVISETAGPTVECIEESDEEKDDVWGSHIENISIEAVNHSIACPSSSEQEEEDTVIVSSQAFSVSKVKNISSVQEKVGSITKTTKDNTFIIFERQVEKSVNSENFTNVNNVYTFGSCSLSKKDIKITQVPENIKDKGDLSSAAVKSLHVVDVCKDAHIFKDFCNQFEEQPNISFSVALCQKFCDNADCDKQGSEDIFNVGANSEKSKIQQKRKRPNTDDEFGTFYFLGIRSLMDGNAVIAGISFSWKNKADSVYFMPLNSSKDVGGDAVTPTKDDKVTFLKNAFESTKFKKRTYIAMHLKEHLRTLFVACGIDNASKSNVWDPKVADWLLNPDGKEKNLRSLCMMYCPEVWKLIEACGYSSACRGCWSMGLDASSSLPPHLRSSIEALVALKSMSALEGLMKEQNLLSLFTDFEMPATCCLVQIEAFGIGFSESQGIHMKSVLASKMRELEKKAYSLAGHSFRMSSPKEVGKVLYQELMLPWRDPKVSSTFKGKKKWSTSKDTLERLATVHRLPRVVMEWRKLSAILSKTVLPLLKYCQRNRIYGTHITHTSTGRISMYEPNLQNIPRDFELVSLTLDPEPGLIKSNGSLMEESQSTKGIALSIRHCFSPMEGFLYLSADYSQLELRLIAHMSMDQKLCSILNKGCDVFCEIASAWKNINISSVTPNLRQQAKGICYGMLYGIGSKTLSEQLGVDETEASNFIETFKNSFPGLKAFMVSAVQKCRAEGFVRTMMGRKRDLPDINSSNPAKRAHAERQAINTIVQGSAADLVKTAMIQIDGKLHMKFLSLDSKISKHYGSSNSVHKRPRVNRSIGNNISISHNPSGAFLVLHLHDELLYEVSTDALESVAYIVKTEMEEIWKLKVELPVNLKVGRSWGALSKYDKLTTFKK